MKLRNSMAAAAAAAAALQLGGCASLQEAGAGLKFVFFGPMSDKDGNYVCSLPGGGASSVSYRRMSFADMAKLNCTTPPKLEKIDVRPR